MRLWRVMMIVLHTTRQNMLTNISTNGNGLDQILCYAKKRLMISKIHNE
jgi:hypothetical protein